MSFFYHKCRGAQDIEASSEGFRKEADSSAHKTKSSTIYVLKEITTTQSSGGHGIPDYAGQEGKGQGEFTSDVAVIDRKSSVEI